MFKINFSKKKKKVSEMAKVSEMTKVTKMTRGHSLEQDLSLLINNPKYSDIEILCKDDKKLHGCRAILAARSEVFDRLLYNAPQETLQVPEEQTTNYQQGQQIIQVHSYGQEV